MSRVSPGTRQKEVEAALIQATTEAGHGVLVRAIYEAHQSMFGTLASRTVPTILKSLEARGIAQKIGGRHRATQWQHAGHPVPVDETGDPAPLLVQIIEDLCAARETALETREVAAELRRRGVQLSIDQVRTRLTSLAHESDQKAARSFGAWSQSRIQRVSRSTPGGKPRVYWCSLSRTLPPPQFAEASDAVRFAVGRASDAIGRPASKREVSLWARYTLDAEGGSTDNRIAAEHVVSPRYRVLLASTAVKDEARPSKDGRLHVVRGALTSRGSYPARFVTRAPTPADVSACAIEDAAALLLPERELDGISGLRREASETRSAVLSELAAARERALADAACRLVGCTASADLAAALEVAERARLTLHGWEAVIGARRRQSSPVGSLDGMRAALSLQLDAGCAPIAIDQSPGVPLEDLEGLAREALAIGERDVEYWTPAVTDARRIRGPRTGGNSAVEDDDPCSFVDRPDALAALMDVCFQPQLSALVLAANALQGMALRDAPLMEKLLARTTSGEPMVRRALVVTLGMLGTPPSLELAWPDAGDAEQAVGYFAAISVGVDDLDERMRLAEAADRRSRGRAQVMSEQFLGRIEMGSRLGVVG